MQFIICGALSISSISVYQNIQITMRFLKRFVLILVSLFVLLLLVSFFLPSKVHVERSLQINARPQTVFAYLNNVKTYDKWMPWNQMDPNWKVVYGSKTEGKGAWFSWESEYGEVGSGRLTITECIPYNKVEVDLWFPEQPELRYCWALEPAGKGTKVVWHMFANLGNSPLDRYIGLFSNIVMGKHFNQGLGNLKKLSEANTAVINE
ncbi:MAG: hypothetical protein C5B52_10020 [Bacteroidetes bacterium]|nr:MAG: hypothetical protein C5B52_10020 [Bacteroidota bacterium]